MAGYGKKGRSGRPNSGRRKESGVGSTPHGLAMMTSVADLHARGRTMQEIGRALDIDVARVCRYVKQLRTEWRTSRLQDMDELTGAELQKIALVEREAFNGWQKSTEDSVETRTTEVDGKEQVTTIRRGQAGNAKFLEVVVLAMQRRAKLLGLDPPTKKDVMVGFKQVPMESREARKARVFARIQELRDKGLLTVEENNGHAGNGHASPVIDVETKPPEGEE